MTQRSQSERSEEQLDLFAAHFTDIPTRDQRDLMERPFFSLAKKPRHRPIEYELGEIYVRVSPNADHGIASIWDADILIWAATQLREALDRGEPASRKLAFQPYNLLKGIRRGTSGRAYQELRQALDRLAGTLVKTSIRAGNRAKHVAFHWLEQWEELFDEASGQSQGMTITLPDWLYQGIIERGGVLRIHEDYFILTGGIERFLYRVARKHAGMQPEGWSFTMRQLHLKSGSSARLSDFALGVRKVAAANALPEYTMQLGSDAAGHEMVAFRRRDKPARYVALAEPADALPTARRRAAAGRPIDS
jgi:plasmid replication initiation protein